MAAPSGPRSGKHGAVNGVPVTRNWTLNILNALERRYHSASRGGPDVDLGIEDWNGILEGFGGFPPFFPGDIVALILFTGPSTGVLGATGDTYTGFAIIDSLTVNWNWQPNNSLNWSASFSADGCLTEVEGEELDVSAVCLDRMCSVLPFIDDDICGSPGSYAEWANVESATLTITSANQMVVNSSTDCCTFRIPGNIDWTLDIVDQEEYIIPVYTIPYGFRMYINGTQYWQLSWGQLMNISNLRVDIETGALVTKTNNFVMNGRLCCGSAAATLGSIIDPAGATQWPIAPTP